MAASLSYESKVELARLRANVGINPEKYLHPVVDSDDRWIDGISEPEDVDIQATPEVRVYGGVQWDVSNVRSIIEPGNPFYVIQIGAVKDVVTDTDSVKIERRDMHDAEFKYVVRDRAYDAVHRTVFDPKTKLARVVRHDPVLLRWNQPDNVLDQLDSIESVDGRVLDTDAAGFFGSTSDRAIWVERMTAFREVQLRALLKKYFGGENYMNREIVLSWKKQPNGKFLPGEKMIVSEWVAAKIEEKGSRLAGFSSCCGTIRSKITRRVISNDATGRSGGLRSWRETYNEV